MSTTYDVGERREALRQQAVEHFKLGKSIRLIAREMGKSYGSVYALLKASNEIEMRDRGYRSAR